jgi:rubrerythrin
MPKQEQLECLALLADNELAVARLYQAYGEKSQSNKDFWTALSKEEVTHSQWIMDLAKKVETGEVSFKQRKFDKSEIQASIDSIREEEERFSNTGINYLSHEEELEIALEKEKGLLEGKLFKYFKTDDDELKKVLKQLAEETEKHRERIAEALRQEKNK